MKDFFRLAQSLRIWLGKRAQGSAAQPSTVGSSGRVCILPRAPDGRLAARLASSKQANGPRAKGSLHLRSSAARPAELGLAMG